MQLRGWMAAAAAVMVLGAAATWTYKNKASDAAGLGAGAPGAANSGWALLDKAHQAADQGTPSVSLSPEQVRTKLFKEGSFVGTEPAGEWCVMGGKLKACPDLRKRFEYYILGLGEVSIGDIKALVADEARRAHGDQASADIMAIWDKYWQLRTYQWRNQFVQSDRSTWMAVFDEQRSVRRQILGEDWAKAFFEDDEKSFKQYYAQLESGKPAPLDPGEPVPQMAPGKDPAAVRAERVARYGEAAADRLAKADDEWADWERRLAAARAEWDRLKNASNLSEAQRRQEMDAYVKANFKGEEPLRVQALLHL